MELFRFDTPRGEALVRLATPEDVPVLIELNKHCFPTMAEEDVVWKSAHLLNHQRVFPEGQIVVEIGGAVVGAVASLIVDLGPDPLRPHTYSGITDGGYFHNHDPRADTLYGADVYVDPSARGLGIGHQLYEARRQLAERLNLRRIVAGGRIDGYHEHADELSPQEYVAGVESGRFRDRVLSFQLREGFVVRDILVGYITDPKSRDHATFIEWLNPRYRSSGAKGEIYRVALAQFPARQYNSVAEFREKVAYFVSAAAGYRADLVVFPEFVGMPLLSQPHLQHLPGRAAMDAITALEDEFVGLMRELATEHNIHLVAGSVPVRRGEHVYNVSHFFHRDGRMEIQPKLHITPSEKKVWGIRGGASQRIITTPKAKLGILVCYDSEFPEAARHLADEGCDILVVPYCTDDRRGHNRVNLSCRARAIENQVYVVATGLVGNVPGIVNMDIHYGQASVYTPCDYGFSWDGIQATGEPNAEMLLVADLELGALERARRAGSVTPRFDRRPDLFEQHTQLDLEDPASALPELTSASLEPIE